MTDWNLQDAKNRFSAVVREALAGYPQHVTRRGKRAVVVLAEAEYDRLRRLESATAPSLADMLLALPRDDGDFELLALDPRPVAFGAPADDGGPEPSVGAPELPARTSELRPGKTRRPSAPPAVDS